jgi:hypothetical protein
MIPLFRDPEHWRARAAETRATVEQFADPESKRLILWIADEYENTRRAMQPTIYRQ